MDGVRGAMFLFVGRWQLEYRRWVSKRVGGLEMVVEGRMEGDLKVLWTKGGLYRHAHDGRYQVLARRRGVDALEEAEQMDRKDRDLELMTWMALGFFNNDPAGPQTGCGYPDLLSCVSERDGEICSCVMLISGARACHAGGVLGCWLRRRGVVESHSQVEL